MKCFKGLLNTPGIFSSQITHQGRAGHADFSVAVPKSDDWLAEWNRVEGCFWLSVPVRPSAVTTANSIESMT